MKLNTNNTSLQAFIITTIVYVLVGAGLYYNTAFTLPRKAPKPIGVNISLSQIISTHSQRGNRSQDTNKKSPQKATPTRPSPTKIPQEANNEAISKASVKLDDKIQVSQSQTLDQANTPSHTDDSNANNQSDGGSGDTHNASIALDLGGGAIDEYALIVRNMILEKYSYPARLRKRGIKGDVKVEFAIDTNGECKANVFQTSNHDSLDNLAIHTIELASSFFPKPKQNRIFHITLGYGGGKILH